MRRGKVDKQKEGSSKGDNYIGIVHRLIISYDDEDSQETKKLGLFVKVPPASLERRKQFNTRVCFLRESLMYDEYLPLLEEFQKSKNINPQIDGFKEYAKCHKCLADELQEAIFMEDLAVKGFRMNDRFVDPSLDVVKMIMKALGKLHALSFALKDQCPDKFAKFRNIEEIFKRDEKIFVHFINGLSELACDVLTNEGDEKYLGILKSFIREKPFYTRVIELLEGTRAEPYAVICHGDCWNNNILFKYENQKLEDAKLIDWQISRFASPVCDLSYYIFSCTTKAFREQYYEEILNVYYSELAQFMQKLGSDASVLFPRSALDDQLKKFGSFGFIMSLMLIPIITAKGDEVPNLDEVSLQMEAGDLESATNAFVHRDPETLSRIRDTVVDVINLGYLS